MGRLGPPASAQLARDLEGNEGAEAVAEEREWSGEVLPEAVTSLHGQRANLRVRRLPEPSRPPRQLDRANVYPLEDLGPRAEHGPTPSCVRKAEKTTTSRIRA
jgi:hypothetical protein